MAPTRKTIRFMAMVWRAFLARVKPVSTSAKPACMKKTRKPVTSVQTKLMPTVAWPVAWATSSSVGAPAWAAGTSVIPPVATPLGSPPAAKAGAAKREATSSTVARARSVRAVRLLQAAPALLHPGP